MGAVAKDRADRLEQTGRDGMSDATEPQVALEAQIHLWREHMTKRASVTAAEVDELEDHLRAEVDELGAAGLSDDEAFLVAVKRLGSQHEIAREFAREDSQRLWKQLVLDDDAKRPREAGDRGGWVPVVIFALIAALVVKLPALFGLTFDDNPEFYLRNVSLLGLVTANILALCKLTLIPKQAVGLNTGLQQVATSLAGGVSASLSGWLLHVGGSYELPMMAIFGFLVLGATAAIVLLRREWAPRVNP